MTIYFSMRHRGALRNFASTIAALAARGHRVHLSFMAPDRYGDGRLLWELLDAHPTITYTELPKKRPSGFWLSTVQVLRCWVDFLRYLEPEYARADKLRERARWRVPRFVAGISRLPLVNSHRGRRWLWGLLHMAERAIPPDPWVTDLIKAEAPDVVLVTPLVDIGSDQTDVVKSAHALGIPTGLCVHSWDNLTNKGLMRIVPDRVFVWNEAQKREAVQMHGVDADAVVVTGAPVFDQWFDRRPETTSEEFCARTGLPPDRPYVLYLGSSAFIAPEESTFVTEWLRALRSATDARVREAAVLIRPHPENQPAWQRFDVSEFPNVVVWPRGGANPVDAQSKSDFFDSIHHGIAAVGINTTAQIEAGIQDRPVFTVGSDEHEGTQEGTLHFEYLVSEGGGLARHARSLEQHVTQLAGAFDRDDAEQQRRRAFVQAFVRPFGLDQAATPRLADGVEALGRLGVRRAESASPFLVMVKWALLPIAILVKLAKLFFGKNRKRRLKALTVEGMFIKPLLVLLGWVLSFRVMKGFVKRYVVPRVMPRMAEPTNATEEMLAVPRIVDRLHHSGKPIIIGPWLSEVGFEILYWIPFLHWVKSYRHFDPERLVVVSRGGVEPWYREIGGRYVDLFDLYSPEEYREKNELRMAETKQKQHVMSAFDEEIIRHVKISADVRDAEVLHPMYMYRLFYPYWKSQASMNLIDAFTGYRRLQPLEPTDLERRLPREYFAMRFYFNDAFPETEENRAFVAKLISRLTETSDVVLLNPGLHLDDHWDLEPEAVARLHRFDELVTPRTNLEMQTRVIAGARAFIGNYGGLSYVAPFYGVDSLAFYSNPDGFLVQHLELAHRMFSTIKRGSFVVLDVQALDLVETALRGSVLQETVEGAPR
jgi:hypothetical protein